MEPHRDLPSGIEDFRPDISAGPRAYFEKAHAFAKKYYGEEMAQIASVKFQDVTDEHFFREYTWVVHATGFSAKAVGKFMPRLMEAYGNWEVCASLPFSVMFRRVKKVCNNPQKAKAVHQMARMMRDNLFSTKPEDPGIYKPVLWSAFKEKHLSSPGLLQQLPYIGKITCFHLGRNIGLLECVKPDLHLVRMAEYWGISDCETMCRVMRADDDLPLGIVDLVVWYAASTFGTLQIKTADGR